MLDITSCIQLEEHHILGLIQVCKQLPLLKIFKAEWSCQFSPETVIDILSSSNLSELAVTPSNWGSPLWAEIFSVQYRKVWRMHHVPNLNEAGMMCNVSDLVKTYDLN